MVEEYRRRAEYKRIEDCDVIASIDSVIPETDPVELYKELLKSSCAQ